MTDAVVNISTSAQIAFVAKSIEQHGKILLRYNLIKFYLSYNNKLLN